MRVFFYTFAMAMCVVFHGVAYADAAVGTLQVSLTDAAGKPVAGAVVMVKAYLPDGTLKFVGRTKESSGAGVATYPELPAGKYELSVVASPTVLAHGELDADVAYPGDAALYKASIKLTPTAQIKGVVVDAEGNPVPKAMVSFFMTGSTQRRGVIAGDAGEFELIGLWAGETYQYSVRTKEFRLEQADSTAFVAQDGMALKLVAARLVPGPLPIRLLDKEGKETYAKVTLSLGANDIPIDEGQGKTGDLVEGTYAVEMTREKRGYILSKASRSVSITRDTKEIVLVLESGIRVNLDLSGNTEAMLPPWIMVFASTSTMPDQEGSWVTLTNSTVLPLYLAPGTHDIAIRAPGCSMWTGQIQVDEDQDKATPQVQKVVFKPAVCLSGVVPPGIDVKRVHVGQAGFVQNADVVDGKFRICGLTVADTNVSFAYTSGAWVRGTYGPEIFGAEPFAFDLPVEGELALTIELGDSTFFAEQASSATPDYGKLLLRRIPDGVETQRMAFVPNTAMSIAAPEGTYLVQWFGKSRYDLGTVEVTAHSVEALNWSTATPSKLYEP